MTLMRMSEPTLQYPLHPRKKQTRVVKIGTLEIGGGHPVKIQSMLSSPLSDIEACFDEIKLLHASKCSLIRLAIPKNKDLDFLPEIRRRMKEEGIGTPLSADIHFSPKIAEEACEFFEKIRINPGNYTDRPKNTQTSLKKNSFFEGREKLSEAIIPLVQQLQKYGCALRIGVNQGSLSTRMIERFGDSPQGMVQSALEMIELFEENGYTQIVVSLKSSNPIIAQKAYRLLDQHQPDQGGVAIHLGVTEAGNGLISRYKSVAGMGALLLDGIGDTLRVSLTEPVVNEIVFAENFLNSLNLKGNLYKQKTSSWKRSLNQHRVATKKLNLFSAEIGNRSSLKLGIPKSANYTSDSLLKEDFTYITKNGDIFFTDLPEKPIKKIVILEDIPSSQDPPQYSALLFEFGEPLYKFRQYFASLQKKEPQLPLGISFPEDQKSLTPLQVTHYTTILMEGLLDFILLPLKMSSRQIDELVNLLQASRSRLLVADYIACPSCGRTLFDLEGITNKIKEKTKHLKGVTIGIMGCIVNGPGEMADADFGYVGSAPGKVDLYYKQNCEIRGVEQEKALDVLMDLLKDHGVWKEPPLLNP